MMLRLSRALDVPLRERNQLLLAAGYAPHYRETGLDAPGLAQVQTALQRMLTQQEPYPAVVMDRHWDITDANDAAADAVHAPAGRRRRPTPANVVRLMFARCGPHVANFDLTGEALIARVHREAVGGIPDPRTTALLDEVLAEPGIPALAHARLRRDGLARSSRCTSSRATSTSATSRS